MIYANYKTIQFQQTVSALNVISTFFKEVMPVNILEIGTGAGGLSLFMKDNCLNSKFLTIDFKEFPKHNILFENGIVPLYIDVLGKDKQKFLNITKKFIQNNGTTIVFCDNGNKILEFDLLSDFLKKGDYILAHDYATSKTVFDNEIKNKVWNWCEITDNDVKPACIRNGLDYYNESIFNSVAWTCRVKK